MFQEVKNGPSDFTKFVIVRPVSNVVLLPC